MFKTAVCSKECPQETARGKIDCVGTKYAGCGSEMDIVATNDVLGMCIVKNPSDVPKELQENVKAFLAKLKEGASGKVIEDLSNSWLDIVICLILAMVYALGYMYLMSTYPTAIAYTAIIFMQLIYIVGGGYCFFQGFKQTDEELKKGMFIGGELLSSSACSSTLCFGATGLHLRRLLPSLTLQLISSLPPRESSLSALAPSLRNFCSLSAASRSYSASVPRVKLNHQTPLLMLLCKAKTSPSTDSKKDSSWPYSSVSSGS
jgi:hypothetical protein